MMNLRIKTLLSIALTLCIVAPISSHAGKIYIWYTTDESGKQVPNYGETPPLGVKATLISDTKDPEPSNAAEKTRDELNLSAEQRKLREKRDQDCKDETARLATLKSSGSRIRMATPDGGSRYLTPEEILQEIKTSEEFLKDACH